MPRSTGAYARSPTASMDRSRRRRYAAGSKIAEIPRVAEVASILSRPRTPLDVADRQALDREQRDRGLLVGRP
jgi:hypothetical protein